MDNLSVNVTTLVRQLEESRGREVAKEEEMTALSREVTEVKDQLQRAEAEVELKRRGLEQAKSRERKLTNEIHEVRIQCSYIVVTMYMPHYMHTINYIVGNFRYGHPK